MLRPNDTLSQEFCSILSLQPIIGGNSSCNLWEDSPGTVETGWTDNSDGSYTCDGTTAVVRQSTTTGLLEDAQSYLVKFTVTARTAGSVRVVLRSPMAGGLTTLRAAVGTYVETISISVPGGSPPNVIELGSVSFAGTISNIEVSRSA